MTQLSKLRKVRSYQMQTEISLNHCQINFVKVSSYDIYHCIHSLVVKAKYGEEGDETSSSSESEDEDAEVTE